MIQVPDEINALLHQDTCKKNIRIHFPDGERADICNGLIVNGSVKLTESLCSQNELKFGLCEVPVFECETVGVGNIKGATIEVLCEIFCDSDVDGAEWRTDLEAYVYPISYGFFTVESCQRQADITHRRITAYGGSSALSDYDPSITCKKDTPWPSATPYSPSIFATAVVNAKINGRLSDATYTEMTWGYEEETDVDALYIRNLAYVVERLELYFNRKALSLGYDDDDLFYFESDDPYKTLSQTIDECSDALFDQIPRHQEYRSIFKQYCTKRIWHNITTKSFAVLERNYPCGSYAYPYQTANNTQTTFLSGYYGITMKYYYRWQSQTPEEYTATVEFKDKTKMKVYKVDYSAYPQARATFERVITSRGDEPYSIADDIDYYELTKAMSELNGVFFNVSRDTIKLLNIKRQFGLIPEGTLYPGSNVYPEGVTGGKLLPNDYRSCWYDDEYTKPFGVVKCTYVDTNNVENLFILYLTGFDENSDIESYKTYDLSDNSIIKASKWTEQQISDICNEIANQISGVSYMPVDFVGRGLPYVEAGDTFEILTRSNDSITTIVLNRTLSGEQTLVDTYKSV